MKIQVEHQLPTKQEEVLYCDMSAMQKKYYLNIKTKGVLVGQTAEYIHYLLPFLFNYL
jgi:SNF2 family DNA or RNA helicase